MLILTNLIDNMFENISVRDYVMKFIAVELFEKDKPINHFVFLNRNSDIIILLTLIDNLFRLKKISCYISYYCCSFPSDYSRSLYVTYNYVSVTKWDIAGNLRVIQLNDNFQMSNIN